MGQDCQEFELVVVDNGSQDGTLDILQRYPQIKLLKNKDNLGVCRARNQVIKDSNSKYILTLDSDVILEKNFISRLLKAAESSPAQIGMWGGTVLNLREPSRIDTLGIVLSKFYRFYDYGQGREFHTFRPEPGKVIGPCACAGMYRREMLEKVKRNKWEYFNVKMFYLIEDFDLALRARREGWGYQYVPEAIAYHLRHGSKHSPKFLQYLSFRNRYLLISNFLSFKELPYLILSLFFYDFPRLLYLYLGNSNYANLALREVFQELKCRKTKHC
jgi:hypothetical protein